MGLFGFLKREKVAEDGLKIPKKGEPEYIPFEVMETDEGDYQDFIDLALKHSVIMLITGKRGSGKSALGMKFLEMYNRKTRKKCYAVGFENAKLPKWIKKVGNIEDASNNSVVLVDEGAVTFSARDSMKESNKFLSKTMAIARHRNLSLLLISQNCMPLNTKILTEDGIRELGNLKGGEKVFSYNTETDKIELKRATLHEPVKKPVITIETEDGDVIECSPDHKMLVRQGDKVVEKPAKDLTEKDELLKPMKFKQ